MTQTMEVLVQVGGQSMKISCGEGAQVQTDMLLFYYCASILHYREYYTTENTLDCLVLKGRSDSLLPIGGNPWVEHPRARQRVEVGFECLRE